MEAGRGSPTLTLNLGSELNYEWEEESTPDQESNLDRNEDNITLEKKTTGNTSVETLVNHTIPEYDSFKIPRKIETERKSRDLRGKKEEIINRDEDRRFDYNRLGTWNRIGGRGQDIKNRLGGRGSKWNSYNRGRPSPPPRNPPPFGRGFRNNYISRPTQPTFSNVETYNQNQPGRSSDYYSNWNKHNYSSKQVVHTRNWDKDDYGSGAGYADNKQEDKIPGPGYYTDREKQVESKKSDCSMERDNNLVNSNTRNVIKWDYDEESVGTLVIDEEDDKNESLKGNLSIYDKVKIWKESANLKTYIKKEISHLELERHKVEFENPLHNTNRTGLEFELIQRLNEEDFSKEKKTKCQTLLKSLVHIEDGYLYQGPEIRTLMKIMGIIKKSRGTIEPKVNYLEEKIILNGKTYQFKYFNGYLGDQMKCEAMQKMKDKPI